MTLALLRAAHPEPAVAVTAITAVLALGAGLGARTWLVAGAVLAGQLSIGWGNDWLDAERDAAAGRDDKPAARGLAARRGDQPALRVGSVAVAVVRAAALAALGLSLALSLLLGVRPAAVHLLGVAFGWAYNLGAKRTLASGLCYAAAFALVPVFVGTLAGTAPPWWLVAAAACLGVGGHLVQTLGDEAADAATGVRGLPQRLGRKRSLAAGTGAFALAAALIGLGARDERFASLRLGLLVASGVAALAATWLGARGRDTAALRSTIASGGLAAIAVVTAGLR